MKRFKKGQLYKFDWNDTYSHEGWFNESEIEALTLHVFQSTVGFFIAKRGDWYIIATHYNPHEPFKSWGTICWIPHKCIRAVQRL